jgi:serine/threonine-protein kinase HipA
VVVAQADVRLHGRRVGRLAYDRGGSTFRYEADLTDPRHQVLGQVFEDAPRALRQARVGVPGWFANLLPEGALRAQVVREIGGGNIGDYTLLSRLGAALPGAVTVHSDEEPADDIGPTGDPEPDHALRHSLAGVQLKYTVRDERLTFPASGSGGWWIVKLADPRLPNLPVNEYLTMSWLTAAGFDVPPVALRTAKEVDGIPAGMVEPDAFVYLISRFDRSPAGRIHVEDFAQVADVEPWQKYGDSGVTYDGLAAVVLGLVGPEAFDAVVERLVAMVVVGNTDAHLKNWGLRYPDGRTPELSPLYDFHSLTVYSAYQFQPLALALNGERMPTQLDADDLRSLAQRCHVDPERAVRAAAAAGERLRAAWSGDVREEARDRYPALADHYEYRLRTLPICAI